MNATILFDDVKLAVEQSRERVQKDLSHNDVCMLAQVGKRITGKNVDGCGFSNINFSDGTRIIFGDSFNGPGTRPSRYFDNHFRTKSAEEIYSYYEAQGLLDIGEYVLTE
jgi:hypothetical protein